MRQRKGRRRQSLAPLPGFVPTAAHLQDAGAREFRLGLERGRQSARAEQTIEFLQRRIEVMPRLQHRRLEQARRGRRVAIVPPRLQPRLRGAEVTGITVAPAALDGLARGAQRQPEVVRLLRQHPLLGALARALSRRSGAQRQPLHDLVVLTRREGLRPHRRGEGGHAREHEGSRGLQLTDTGSSVSLAGGVVTLSAVSGSAVSLLDWEVVSVNCV
ncbi:hypothetical protein ACFJIX_21520 [Roseateles sp. UC29_93]|uniref:hypothetical protein n=1 Tax=Roseateles sp. UC29_93 TaxID=3350177 RepID=UPI003672AB08